MDCSDCFEDSEALQREDPSVSAQHKWPGRAGNVGALWKNPTEATVPSHLVGPPRRSLTADSISKRLLTTGHLNKDARSSVEGGTSVGSRKLSLRKRNLAQESGGVIYEIQCCDDQTRVDVLELMTKNRVMILFRQELVGKHPCCLLRLCFWDVCSPGEAALKVGVFGPLVEPPPCIV